MATSMGRVLPIILAHHDYFDSRDYQPMDDEEIPLEARVIAVADVYDALISDRPYCKAIAPFEARETIRSGPSTEYDPAVVKAFLRAYDRGLLEVPEVYV
jgi:response regulator RpfG family c-di-GMP phosphodiesterase